MTTPSTKRDLLSISDVAADLGGLLASAARLKANRDRFAPSLAHRNIGLLFEKPSTRTRTSFEVAANDLGARALYFSTRDLQLGRGETIGDTARVLSRYLDAICFRAARHEDIVELARQSTIPVVNALDDLEHPCQIVADLLTMRERWNGRLPGHRLAWIGDGNNVLHSLLLGAAAVGLDLTAATPDGYRPLPEVVREAEALARRSGAHLRLTGSPEDAARGAHAIYTDVWVSMGDEEERAARERAFQGFQVNSELLDLAAPDAFVLHDLPAHRGQEITDEVLDGPRSAAWDQAENRLHAQKAILELLLLPTAGRPLAPPPRRSPARPRSGPRARRAGGS